MANTKLGKGLAALTAVPATLSTPEASEHDQTGAAIRIEQTRYERLVLDFETEIRRRRDARHAEHIANMAAIFAEAGE